MDSNIKALAKYLRTGIEENEEDTVLKASQPVNPIHCEIPYYATIEKEENNYLTFMGYPTDNTIKNLSVQFDNSKHPDYRVLFSFDGVSWSKVDAGKNDFELTECDKLMFKADGTFQISYIKDITFQSNNKDAFCVTGNYISLVSDEFKIIGTLENVLTPRFSDIIFNRVECLSVGDNLINIKLYSSLFGGCTLNSFSTDFEFDFSSFSNENNCFANNNCIIFDKNGKLNQIYVSIKQYIKPSLIIRIFDTNVPYVLKALGNCYGILDRNIGAKTIFDYGSFFEFAKNPFKQYSLNDIIKLEQIEQDDGTILTDYVLGKYDPSRWFLGPNYKTPDLQQITNETFNFNVVNGFPIIHISEPYNNNIRTGILLKTLTLSSSGLTNDKIIYTSNLTLINENYKTIAFDFIRGIDIPIDNWCFRTIRPITCGYKENSFHYENLIAGIEG